MILLTRDPDLRLRDLAEGIGVTERAAQRIVRELEEAGYVSHTRAGRRNHYRVNAKQQLRHDMDSTHQIGELLAIFTTPD